MSSFVSASVSVTLSTGKGIEESSDAPFSDLYIDFQKSLGDFELRQEKNFCLLDLNVNVSIGSYTCSSIKSSMLVMTNLSTGSGNL